MKYMKPQSMSKISWAVKILLLKCIFSLACPRTYQFYSVIYTCDYCQTGGIEVCCDDLVNGDALFQDDMYRPALYVWQQEIFPVPVHGGRLFEVRQFPILYNVVQGISHYNPEAAEIAH